MLRGAALPPATLQVRRLSAPALEELDGALVTLRGSACRKRAEIAALAGLRVLFSGVQAVLSGRKLANHLQPRRRLARTAPQETAAALLPHEIVAIDNHLTIADYG